MNTKRLLDRWRTVTDPEIAGLAILWREQIEQALSLLAAIEDASGPTPETDEAESSDALVESFFARRLERERNAALRKLAEREAAVTFMCERPKIDPRLGIDHIAVRDETIRLLEAEVARLKASIKQMDRDRNDDLRAAAAEADRAARYPDEPYGTY